MRDIEPEVRPAPFGVNEVLFTLCRHKKKILLFALLGIVGALVVYFALPRVYESEAKLLVRYVVERSVVDNLEAQKTHNNSNYGDSLINAEVDILSSWDLTLKVVDTLAMEKMLANRGLGLSKEDAVQSIRNGLLVSAKKGSNVISVVYRHQDPALAGSVLDELVARYFDKHLEVHRSAGSFNFVAQQSDQVRARLNQTEEELKQLKAKAGVTALAADLTTLNLQISKSQDDMNLAAAEFNERAARVGEFEKLMGVSSAVIGAPVEQVSIQVVQNFQALGDQLAQLRKARMELLSRYTEGNAMVQANQQQIVRIEGQRTELLKNNPGLSATALATSQAQTRNPQQPDLLAERGTLAAVRARVESLKIQNQEYAKRRELLADMGPQIERLERKKEMEEGNYKYFEASLEKARVDEALDPSKMPNISVVQRPSPPAHTMGMREKLMMAFAGGGLGLGLVLAFLIELIFDPSIKRPSELGAQLNIPVLMSIPYDSQEGRLRIAGRNGDSGEVSTSGALVKLTDADLAPWEPGHFIRHFSESLRDRLTTYFEIRGMTHKPKLVAVTGAARRAGTSTIAGGLAAALSETGDGKVLLVDMNLADTDVHPFFRGKPSSSIADALEGGSEIMCAAENLYLATAGMVSERRGARLAPRRFYDMVPHFKGSDFDYIIFDMPPLSESSATLAMAGFMDKVLLVVEAERSHRDATKRAYDELVAAKADVSSVCNKTRSYAPKWLQREF